ncbi:hypothetical protein [Seonamhaeicola sp. ML3]|uniref:hypothetical protein n=1 Tax=Seonamhaeicola sp. ML3 TaxID=2937786 RepID=UPI00200C986E|nr:hypothetical protein [Seonamhaeicola sp. ML3]
MKTRYYFGITFLLLQVISIIYALFISERFFCWAPYDEHTYIQVSVEIDGKQLTKREVKDRYRYKAEGWEPRSINNVFNIITQYETTYGINDNANVLVKYETNGNKQRIWRLKQ